METNSAPLESQTADTATVDAVVVGAGFAGMYMLHRLRQVGLTARVIEAGSDVGGTWYWNRYPGARCDVESLEYQYSFSDALQREWNWTERYAQQPEILAYASHVADRFDLRRDIQFNTRVTAAAYDDARQRWIVETDAGDRFSAQFCIMATGCLSKPKWPEIPGRESFRGEACHTALWPHEGVDFAGKRVGVIGTGSTAVQAIPRIAEQAAHVTVFQRTPNFSVPAKQEPHEPAFVQQYKDEFQALRRKARRTRGGIIYQPPPQLSALEVEPEERERLYAESWEKGAGVLPVFTDLLTNEAANETAASFIRSKIQEIVDDPAIAAALCPTNHPYGTKRPCLDTDYYEAYNRDNVRLVDVRATPIATITPTGLRTGDEDFHFDTLVFACGFDAMTGAILAVDIRGREGRSLREKWSAGPRTYLGLSIAGFPNLFTITGPGSPSVLANMIVCIEQHVDWIADCIVHLREREVAAIEATPAAEDAWVDHVNELGEGTLYPRADSWYVGANVPGKPRVFTPYVGGLNTYVERCEAVVANDYEGFALAPRARAAAVGP